MGKSNFTEEQLEQIKHSYLSGKSIKNISEEMNFSYTTILKTIKKMGIFQRKQKQWTTEELNYLKENYPYEDWSIILQTLNRWTKDDIIGKASKLKIKREIYFWSDNDILILKDSYEKCLPTSEIKVLLNNRFAESAIIAKAYKLGITKREWWSEEENKLLIQIYGEKSIDEICEMFPNRSRQAIIAHASTLNLVNKVYWKDEEIEFIKNNYQTMSDAEMSVILGRGCSAVSNKRCQLHLFHIVPPGVYNYLSEYIRKRNKEWKKNSSRNCNYRCVITGERFHAIHHLYGMNLILNETLQELSFSENIKIQELSQNDLDDILNHFFIVQNRYPLGICLSKTIHKQFHDEYGYGNNTPEQFNDFLKKHKYKIA